MPYYAFRIRKDANNYYAVQNGIVQLLAAPADPALPTIFDLTGIVNFSDEGQRFERHPDWHGVFTSYSESLEFADDALKIVERIFYSSNGDIEATAQLEVRRCNPSFDNYTELFDPFFIGDIDFSTFVPNVDDNGKAFVSLNTKDGGITAIIKANENIPYRIGLDLPGTFIYMDGVRLRDNFLWSPIGSLDIPIGTSSFGFVTTIPSSFLLQDSEYADGIGNTPFYTFMPDNSFGMPTYDDDTFNNYYLYKAKIDILNANFTFKVKATIYNDSSNVLSSTFIFQLLHVGKNKVLISNTLLYRTVSAINVGDTLVVEIDVTTAPFTMSEGDELFLTARFDLAIKGTLNLEKNPDDLQTWKYNLYVDFKPKPTITNSLNYHDAAKNLIEQITGNNTSFRSDFLSDQFAKRMDNYPFRTHLTCGDSLRNLPDAGMQMTLDDLFSDFTARWCGGLGIENEVVILEPIQYFYQDIEIIYLDSIKSFRATPDLSMRGNLLKVGMPDQDYDALNGKDEANGTHIYKLPFIRTTDTFDQTNTFRSDAIGIESIRTNLIAKDTTDNKGDNEIFVISISDNFFSETIDGVLFSHIYRLLRRNTALNTTGILSPETHYNLDLYPKRNFYRNAPLISAYCWKRDGETITFQTLDKNKDLVSNLGTDTVIVGDGEVVETGDVLLPLSDSFPQPSFGSPNIQTTPVFLPMLLLFTAIVPEDFADKMAQNPYGYIRVTWNGIDYKGFINKAGMINAENNTYDFELQAHPDCNFEDLSYA